MGSEMCIRDRRATWVARPSERALCGPATMPGFARVGERRAAQRRAGDPWMLGGWPCEPVPDELSDIIYADKVAPHGALRTPARQMLRRCNLRVAPAMVTSRR